MGFTESVPSRAASSPLYYITALTALYESIAMIVDQHQPVVERYYGPGKMTSVLKRLLQESDRVTKDLIEGWEEERSMKRKVSHLAWSAMSQSLTECPACGYVLCFLPISDHACTHTPGYFAYGQHR